MRKPLHPVNPLLRAAAEARLAQTASSGLPARPTEELLRELQLHQIELEIQNEVLRQSQIALAESRDRYADLYDSAPVGYLTVSAEGLIEEINRTGASWLGKEAQELLKTWFTAMISPEDRWRWIQHVRNMKQGLGQSRMTLALQRADGTLLQAQLDCALAQGRFALQSDASTVVRVVLTDITALVDAQRAVHNERKRIKTILDVAADPIFVKDNDHRIILANRAFCDLFGLEEAQVIGKTLAENVPEDERELFLAIDRRVLDTGIPDVREESLTVHQVQRTIVTSKTRFTEDSGERFLVGVIFDITERTQAAQRQALLEAQLRESQKMQAIGTLAGGIAHDFNNIIAAILGHVELARQDLGSHDQALESVQAIGKAAARARALVQQILSFSRQQPTERVLLSMESVVDESVRLLRATIPARITLDVSCDPNLPLVLADSTQMEQVLINLVTNAAQAMATDPGRIEIGLDAISAETMLVENPTMLPRMQTGSTAGVIRLAVKDNGPGMSEETLSRIFEPFFTTKPVGQGTGLGLSVAHGIVQNHGGVLQARSRPGEGSTFTVYLPATDAQADSFNPKSGGQVPAPPSSIKSGLRILYLDDDEALVELVTKLFRKRDILVTGHTDQHEALQALRADPTAYDLLLTDYNMPGMSGLDVAREVGALMPDLPVAIISGFIDETLREQAQRAGVRDLIFKADRARASPAGRWPAGPARAARPRRALAGARCRAASCPATCRRAHGRRRSREAEAQRVREGRAAAARPATARAWAARARPERCGTPGWRRHRPRVRRAAAWPGPGRPPAPGHGVQVEPCTRRYRSENCEAMRGLNSITVSRSVAAS
jgi:two-component system, cell cycle sensor histidine kinase and response regulator CckA